MPLANAQSRSPAPEEVSRLSSELAHEHLNPLPHVVSTRAADTIMLMDLKRGTYYTLNEAGGRVWELVEAGATVSEIVERLLGEYGVPRSQLEHDVTVTLRQWIDDGLLAPGIASDSIPVERTPKPPAGAKMNARSSRCPQCSGARC